ncbi:unnamed protein product [Acanthoscelides obtectus]|nr:unnamed protein product [Acanthoscelides obtectus]CAK1655121.1 Cordon-bleu protein-like 1 [Acanthoscelides obtectus]
MMDLLVQITAKQQLQLSGYTLQALSMAPWSDEYDKVLPYKPNTPIGTLDTQHVKVVAKSRSSTLYKKSSPGQQPFESTFRLKVFLPRNQLFVTRVHTDVLLEQIMRKVCEEKCLDPRKYEFRNPGNLDETLDPKLTLSDYQITEIYLVAKGLTNFSQVAAAANVTVMRKEEETKQMHNKTGGGVFNLIFRRGKAKNGTLKKENSTWSTESTEQCPKVPQRKRRPAPKPPSTSPGSSSIQENQREEENATGSGISETDSQVRKTDASLLICHSRNSSDSSGYHEASVLSENNASLPRRPKSALVARESEGLSKMYSQSVTNLTRISSKPSTSLAVPARRKKPAPLPPPLRASSTALNVESPVSAASSQQVDNTDENLSSQQPYDSIVSCHAAIAVTKNEHSNCFGSTDSGIAQETLEKSVESDPSYNVPAVPPPPISASNMGERKICPSNELQTTEVPNEQESDTIDWQYQLPSPPKPFKDAECLADDTLLSKCVGVPYSELFEKLKQVEEVRAEGTSTTNEADSTPDDTPIKGKSSTLTSSSGSTIDDISGLRVKRNTLHEKEFDTSTIKSSITSDTSEFMRKSSVISSRSNSTLDNLSDISEHPYAVKEKEQLDIEMSEPRKNVLSTVHNGTESESSKRSSITDTGENRKTTLSPIYRQSSNSNRSSISNISGSRIRAASPIQTIDQSENSKRSSIADTGDTRKDTMSPIYSLNQSDSSERSSMIHTNESRMNELKLKPSMENYVIASNTVDSRNKMSTAKTSDSYLKNGTCDSVVDTVNVKTHVSTDEDTRLTSSMSPISMDRKGMQDRRSSSTSSYANQHRTDTSTNTISVCTAAPNSSPSLDNEEKKSSPSTYNKFQNSSPSPPKHDKTPSPPPIKFIQRRVPTNTLPNFKISTYNEPKQKITVFEDDTIRSNANRPASMYAQGLSKNYFGGSFQDLGPNPNVEKKRIEEPPMNFSSLNSVSRSDSFSCDNVRMKSKPVSRSKSHINLNANRWRKIEDPFEEEMYKSNSLYDLSGLQSLEVMRLIQNKLTTSTTSLERMEDEKPNRIDRSNTFNDRHKLNSDLSSKEIVPTNNPIRYRYQMQPSVNMGTWAERPKVTINAKLSEDHTLKQRPHSVAFPQDYDPSRVPVVRSVELKKHFKAGDVNLNPKEPVLDLGSNDSAPNINRVYNRSDKEPPNFVSRVNFFRTAGPTVRGFKNSSNTLDLKDRKVYSSNRNSFEFNTQTGNRYNTYLNGVHRNGNSPEVKSPPVPPVMPKEINNRVQKPVHLDTRSQLLEEIRNFGGKKGFRTAQV